MAKKIVLVIGIAILAFFGFVASRNAKFHYENSGLINAPADRIFPYLSSLKMGEQWSPFDKADPNMKKIYAGADGQVGSSLEFDGNHDVGSGKLEIMAMVLNQTVGIKLSMSKPIAGDSFIQYKLTPEGEATRFTWSMSGESGFLGKMMTLFFDCEKMMREQFGKGIANLKTLVETAKPTN